ncbi:MAG: hypothetical protein EXS35_04055 [Pedosphaera sp.]|nr:hypothetical protein [Pedosphaera sp.]
MPDVTADLPPPVNHVLVDFENVHEINHAVIGNKTVSFTLLLGARQTKLDVSLVEKLLEHAASVQLVRLSSSGKNALDFTLAYYVGRAVAADPTGFFHIVSKDTGYDPLIEHLRSKHIRAHRHDDFTSLTFSGPAKLPAPIPIAATPKPKSPIKPKAPPASLDQRETQVLAHLRKPSATRPKNKDKLASFFVAHLGHKITDGQALDLIENLSQAGHLTIGEKGKVTYHLEPK